MSDLQQGLMDEVYNYWRSHSSGMTRLEACDHFGPAHRAAVQLGNLNYQVHNGGFMQWYNNGYWEEDIDDLFVLCSLGQTLSLALFGRLSLILTRVTNYIEDYGEDATRCEECGAELRCRNCGSRLPEWVQELVRDSNNNELTRELDRIDQTYYDVGEEAWLGVYNTLIRHIQEETNETVVTSS
jgi:hypothetical protein